MNSLNIQVGIMGAAGYTGGELIRLLINHPHTSIRFAHSRSHAGSLISDVHTDLVGDTDLRFADTIADACNVVFLCMGHGESKKIRAEFNPSVKIIDLSQDFRIHTDGHKEFVYGLPELNREHIRKTDCIANPGCFATAIQLALLPLAQKHTLQSAIHISCTTGSTGAGQSLSETSHFSWRENNLSVYKAFTHQHLGEIRQSLQQLQPGFDHPLWIIPQRGAFTRGILACITLENKATIEENYNNFTNYYHNHPFVYISKNPVNLKQVVNTNRCLLHLEKHLDQLLITVVLDNLLKGASGQAVQNMNILFSLDETTGLKLKASAF